MAISTDQKVDYLWKKLGYGRTKTDVASVKDAVNESISSPLFLRGDTVWTQTSLIPSTIPGSSTSYVNLYPTSAPVECTVDITASTNRTWKTNIIDWIPPELGSTYLVKVYIHTSGNPGTAASSGTQVFAAGSGNNDEWFFDYQSGVLNFIGTNLPNGVNFTGKSVYISGAVYTGLKGAVSAGAATTFTNLSVSGTTDTQHLRVTGFTTTVNQSITGVATVGSNLAVAGVTTSQHLNVTGFTTVVNQSVTGVATIGTLGVSGVTTSQHLNVTGFTTVVNQSITGVATVGSNLAVAGVTTTRHLNVIGFTTVVNQSITGVATVGSNLAVAGVTTSQHLNVTGFTTVVNQSVTGVSTIGTLAVSGVTTTQHLNVTGFTTVVNQSITGVSTIGTLAVSGVTTSQHLNITGFTTVANQSITGVATVGSNLAVVGVTTTQHLNVTGFTTVVNESVTGVATIATLNSTSATLTNINSTGITTIGVVTAGQVFVSGVTTSAGGFVGNLTGIAASATKLVTPRTFQITGDVVASTISFDGTGNVSLAATIQPNSVGLGTDTTGDYIRDITGTANQITVTGGTGEGSTPIISVPNQFTAPQDVTVTRDLQVNRNLNVNGNITIGGTAATLFTTELKVSDPDIVLGFRTDSLGNDISNDTTANHGGVAVASTEGTPLISLYDVGVGETNPATYKKFMWFKSGTFSGLGTDAWLSNYAIGIGSTQFPNGTRLVAGNVQITQNDLAVVRNINASGIATATTFNGQVNAGVGTITTLSGTTATYTTLNGTTGNINTGIITTLSGANLNYSGFGTVATLSGTTATYTTLNGTTGNINTGIITTLSGTTATYTTLNGTTGNINTGIITTLSGTTATYTTLNGTTGNINTGIITTLSGTNLNYSGVSTIGTLGVAGVTTTRHLNVTGFTTVVNQSITGVATVGLNLAVAGVTTTQHLNVTGFTTVVNQSITGVATIGTLAVSGVTTTQHLNVVGFTTIVNESVTGVSTIGTLAVSGVTTTRHLNVIGFTTVVNQSITGVATIGSNLAVAGVTTTQHLGVVGVATISVNSSSDALRITQTGSGNALVVEDETSPDATPFVVTATGDVGIGTTNTGTYALHINAKGASRGLRILQQTNDPEGGAENILAIFGNKSFWSTNDSASIQLGFGRIANTYTGDGTNWDLRFLTGSSASPTEKLRITGGGAVLVGTATSTGTASQTLQVTGGAYITGNLGIGTTNPTSRLHVIGDGLFSGIVTALSFSGNASSATYATSAGIATNATYATSSGISTYATSAGIATYATSAGIATNATYATSSGISTYATSAGIATYATSAGIATNATYATSAGIATNATYATSAGIATYATSTGIATYATSAGIATYATTAGVSTSVSGGIASVTQLNVSGVSTISVNSSSDALRITQTGSGNALVVEDSANPDATPFVVKSDGKVAIGTITPLNSFVVSNGLDGIEFSPGALSSKNRILNVSRNPTLYIEQETIASAFYFSISSPSDNALTITNTRSVGIGITSPSNKLHVSGNARIDGNTNPYLVLNDGTNTGYFQIASGLLDLNHNGDITFSPGGSQKVRINSTGSVGIGTTNPISNLHINSTTARSIVFTGDTGSSYLVMGNKDSGGTTGPVFIQSGNRNLIFGVGDSFTSATAGTNTEYMRLDSSGNLLVGSATSTGTASQRLQITGGAYVSGNLGVGVTNPLTKLESKGNVIITTSTTGNNILAFGDSRTYGPLTGAPDTSHGSSFIIGNSSTASGAPSYLSFWTTSGGTVGERARIDSSGNLGIGTTNPSYKLDVQSSSNDVLSIKGGTNATFMVFDNNSLDDYKIGGVNVVAPFVVYNNTDARYEMVFDGTGNVLIGSQTATGTSSQPLQVTGGAYVSGNLGVGITNPTTKLDVIGNIRAVNNTFKGVSASAASLSFSVGGNSSEQSSPVAQISGIDRYNARNQYDGDLAFNVLSGNVNVEVGRFTYGGSLGIGTTNPTSKLHVIGDTRIVGTVTATAFVGDGSGLTNLPGGGGGGTNYWVQTAAGIHTLGNVGVGTTNPDGRLTISAASSQDMLTFKNNATTFARLGYNSSSGSDVFDIRGEGIVRILSGGNNERVRITGIGSVGIGTTNPQAALHSNNPNLTAPSLTFGAYAGHILRSELSELAFGLDSNSPFSYFIQARRSTNIARNIVLNPLGGDIGIGTTNPTSRLHVSGDARIVGTVTATAFVGDGSGLTNLPSSGSSQWVTTAAGIHTLSNVGIGTTNPTSRLTVSGNALVTGISTLTGSVSFGSSASFINNQHLNLGTGNDLKLYHSGTTGVINNTNGELQIGCDVVRLQSNIFSTPENYLVATKNAQVELYYDNSKEFETTGYGATVFGVLQTQGLFSSGISTISVNSSSDAVRITQLGSGNALVVEDETNPDSTPFVVSGIGSVGIGITNPGAKLTISENSFADAVRITQTGFGNALVVEDSSNPDSTPFVIDASGFVGVGTITPSSVYKLQVHGGGDSYIQFTNTSEGTGSLKGLVIGYDAGGDRQLINSFNKHLVLNTTNAGNHVVIQPTAARRVGIGTTDVLEKLHVVGNVLVAAGNSTGQHITQKPYELNNGTLSWEGSAGQLFSITNNLTSGSIFSVNDVSGIPSVDVNADGTISLAPYGSSEYVGIGTTVPTSKLTVIGNTLITGILTATNLAATNELQGDAFESYEIDLIGYTGYHLRTEETTITFTATNDTTTDPYLWGTTITLPIEDSDFAEDSTFVPFFDSEVVSIENPFRLMITVNGVLQSAFINNTDYVYQSNFLGSRNGYTIDSDNNIKFTESIPIGSDIVARVLPVSSTATKIKNYPFKPTDIVLGY